MLSFQLIVSPKTLNYFLGLLLYVPVSAIVLRLLFPRLTRAARFLALVMLAAQMAVILVALEAQPTSAAEEWLWDLDKEWNIPSGLASTQLSLIGGIALLTAWQARAWRKWNRLWTFAFGLVCLFLGLEEFLDTKHADPNWPLHYALLGIAVAAATLAAAARAPRRQRIWFISLFFALALMATGVFLIDETGLNCGSFAILQIDGCLSFQTIEELFELLGSWVALIAILGLSSDGVTTPSRRDMLLVFAFSLLWLAMLPLVSPISTFEFQLKAEPVNVEFESGARLYGYEADRQGLPTAGYFYFSNAMIQSGMGYSVHLVDQASGDSVAGVNRWANREHQFYLSGKSYLRVYYQLFKVSVPPDAPSNRAFWVVLALWRAKGADFEYQKILSSDRRLLSDTQVVLGELVLTAESAPPVSNPVARFDNRFTLERVDIPGRARAGETSGFSFAWQAAVRGNDDYTQFLHFVNEETGAQRGYDQRPLGARLPTRLWYRGLADSETWRVPFPADLAPGRYQVFAGLYRESDTGRLPASDATGAPFVDARVPLGRLIVEGE